MESFGIIGFIFGLAALSIVLQQKKIVKTLKEEVDELKKKIMNKLKAFWAKQSISGKIIWICVIINTVLIAFNLYTGRLSF
jgi:hypothetical protein